MIYIYCLLVSYDAFVNKQYIFIIGPDGVVGRGGGDEGRAAIAERGDRVSRSLAGVV